MTELEESSFFGPSEKDRKKMRSRFRRVCRICGSHMIFTNIEKHLRERHPQFSYSDYMNPDVHCFLESPIFAMSAADMIAWSNEKEGKVCH